MTIRTSTALLAVAALVLLSVSTLATPAANAAPVAPSITFPSPVWSTTQDTTEIYGSDPGWESPSRAVRFDITISNSLVTDAPFCPDLPLAMGADGLWECTLGMPVTTLAMGSNILTVIASENADGSDPSPPATVEVIRVAPPTITAPSDGLHTSNATPTVSGTSYPGDLVTVKDPAEPVDEMCSATAGATGDWSCTSVPLPDGELRYFAHGKAWNSATADRTITIDTIAPAASTITGPAGTLTGGVLYSTTDTPHPVITGTGEDAATVTVYQDFSPIVCAEGPVVVGGGAWSCTLTAPLSVGSSYSFATVQEDRAGNASTSGSPDERLVLTVVAPPLTVPPATPPAAAPPVATSPDATPLVWTLVLHSDGGEVSPGQEAVIGSAGLPPGAVVEVELHSTPVLLGTTAVAPDGAFMLRAVIPEATAPGEHHYVVTVSPEGQEPITARLPVTVLAPAELEPASPPITQAVGSPAPPTGARSPGEAVDRDEPAAPSSFTGALPTLQQIVASPIAIAAAAASGLALLLLVAFPAELLNTTIAENYQRWFGRLPKLRMPWGRERDTKPRSSLANGLFFTTIAALIFSFSDPDFGLDLTSLRLFLACLIGMLVMGYLASALTGVILRRRWSIASLIAVKPAGVVVAAIGVILSRLLDFTPGLLIGLVLGLSLAASARTRDHSRAVLVWSGIVLAVAVACWVAYSLFTNTAPDSFGGALLDDTLVAITTEGISGLVVGMLPIGFFDGRAVFQHSKLHWALSYLAALAAFFLIVVPSGALWGDIRGPLWVWLTVLTTFAAVSIAVYFLFRSPRSLNADLDGTPEFSTENRGTDRASRQD